MDTKLLTEGGWKELVQKFRLRDNGLQRALALYEKLPDKHHAERLKALESVSLLAEKLQKAGDVALIPRAVSYLDDVGQAAEGESKQLQAELAKTAAAAKKQAGQDKKDEAEEVGDYPARLLAALQKLKSTKDLAFEFLLCDGKPHCSVMLAKKITPQHRTELSRLAGGSKRFLPEGTCQFGDGKYTFRMEQPPTGLAKKLQDSIKHFTGKKMAIVVGAESAEEDE